MNNVVKDYMGYLMGEEVKLAEHEIKFMEAEKERFNLQTNMKDLDAFLKSGNEMMKNVNFDEMDMQEELIFESLKAAHILKPILEEGDTYFDIDKKIASDPKLRRAYNIITGNVFKIYERAGMPDLNIA